jgi:hypothetical protein
MFILKMAIALAVTLFTLYIASSCLYGWAKILGFFRNSEDIFGHYPILGTAISVVLSLICVFTWKVMF